MRHGIRTGYGKMALLALMLLAAMLLAAGAAAQEATDAGETGTTWTSSDPSVATVDELGNVTPVSPGVTVVSAHRGGEVVGQVTLTVSGVCPHCGGDMFDGSASHTTKWSVFDPEDHYKCTEEATHRCESCGRDFPCSLWGSHTPCAVCERPWCDKSHGEHTLCPLCEESRQCVGSHGIGKCVKKADCGLSDHYEGDDKGPHKRCSYCDKWRCNGQDHTLRPCKLHCKAQLKNQSHEKLPCGHYACQGGDHEKLPCGHYACQSGSHEKLPCGHYACESGNHEKLPCGHYACQGGNHEKLGCGHYACQSGNHERLQCGHYACQGGTHGVCLFGCGGYLCDGKGHGTNPGQCAYVPPDEKRCPSCRELYSDKAGPGCDFPDRHKGSIPD